MTSHRQSQSLLIVQHDYQFSLYLSDETGTFYTLSLEDIAVEIYDIASSDFVVDLEIVSDVLLHE